MILRGDEGWSKSPAPHWIAIATFNTTSYSSSEGVVQPWLMLYRQIYYCNQIFDYMNDRGYNLFTDKGEADRIIGQAYFMRGFSYWYLAGTYAKGPRQVNSTDNGEMIEQEEIYKQAMSDFQEAEKLFRQTGRILVQQKKEELLSGAQGNDRKNCHATGRLLQTAG